MVGLVVVAVSLLVVLALNIAYQFFLIRQSQDKNRITFPRYISKICNPHHLLYELKSSHSRVFAVLTR